MTAWRQRGTWYWLDRLVALWPAAVLAACGVGMAVYGMWDLEALYDAFVSMQRDPSKPKFDREALAATQARAGWAAVMYFVSAAGCAAVLRPTTVRQRRRECRLALRWKLRSDLRTHGWALIGLTLVAAVASAWHLGQPMRDDEARMFSDLGARPAIVSLVWYHSTNNHPLFAALMRWSVWLFGPAEWAIRLPAWVAGVASVPAMWLAVRTIFNRRVALAAAALMAAAPYTADLATNARGYALMHVMFLLSVSMLPAAARGGRAAMAGVVAASAVGAWAVPVMIYPFSIVAGWLGWRLVVEGRHRWAGLGRTMLIVLGTGVAVLGVYLPTWAMLGRASGPVATYESSVSSAPQMRVDQVLINLDAAWRAWTQGTPSWLGWCLLVITLAGWVVAMRGDRRERAFAVAAVAGPTALWLVTRLAPLPAWSMTFGYLLYVMAVAVSLEAGATWALRRVGQIKGESAARWIKPTAVAAGVAIGVLLTLRSGYPERPPFYYGYVDAEAAARYLQSEGLADAPIVVNGELRGPLNYYLFRETGRRSVVPPAETLDVTDEPWVIEVVEDLDDTPEATFEWIADWPSTTLTEFSESRLVRRESPRRTSSAQ